MKLSEMKKLEVGNNETLLLNEMGLLVQRFILQQTLKLQDTVLRYGIGGKIIGRKLTF